MSQNSSKTVISKGRSLKFWTDSSHSHTNFLFNRSSQVSLPVILKSKTLAGVGGLGGVTSFCSKTWPQLLRLFMILSGTICISYCGTVGVCVFDLGAAQLCMGCYTVCFKNSFSIHNSKMQMSPRVLEKGLWTCTFH